MYFSGSTWFSLAVLKTVMRIPATSTPFSEQLKRKNWPFANTRKGGDVSCAMNSPAETAIHNGFDVWAYRKWLLSELPHKKKDGFAYSDCLPWTGSGKERKAVRNKGKTASDTDIICLRRRFGYTSLFFTLAFFSKNLQKFTPSLNKMPTKGDTIIGNDVWIG